MRGQWGLISGLIFVLLIAIFAVINVEAVRVNYLFGTADWPLILVILVSVLMGGLIVGSVGIFKVYQLQQEIKRLKLQLETPRNEDETTKTSRAGATSNNKVGKKE
ncbi:DUF1049 domain-containing protein [Salipaludibacillus agaradhaerens]|uniref:LapA family protein n=1 Tax=Salipaludibacillus agaradhaerens TaxID=76935 RepID=UPI0021511C6E|nr:lipopolysaccharide assembly protein LapA domain-containing protein [Salipaludibacillus agaradhaerens]MCR6106198.1 DUF1049 domain-containing protein [Salipaludibacillus agaradhaerens]MCR6118231.1 DUF1049 domain-containing protein [Salipaludibacillus agaradhaerens]UJW57343.1 DUF1049 domain-containing protein [Bacillus sp. A116_S68]